MEIKEVIFLVEEDPEGGYTAKALGYSVAYSKRRSIYLCLKYQGTFLVKNWLNRSKSMAMNLCGKDEAI